MLHPNLFCNLIRNFCDEYDAVFIADSVQCGYGRTGKFYSHDYAGVDADIYSMAKGMGNGFPVGAISIAPIIEPNILCWALLLAAIILACAAALAVLEVMEKENLMKNAEEIGNYLMEKLKKFRSLKNVRGKGLMIGFDVPDELKDLKKNLLQNIKYLQVKQNQM